jgi:MFS family permease
LTSTLSPVPAAHAGPDQAAIARPGWLIPTHIAAVSLVQSTWMAIAFITPVLALKRFGANEWQTLLITATPTIFFSLSIFWNDLFSRRSLPRYLMTFWMWAGLPLALVAFANDYWMLLVPHLLSCVGGAGYHPAAGELLRSLYPEKVRGRVYSIIWGASMVVGAGGGYVVGSLMDQHPDAFRVIFPSVAVLQLLGCGLFVLLAHKIGHTASRVVNRALDERSSFRRVAEPIGHMKDILKADPIFARYEAAFMTYGVGWMICYALVPILVTKKLGLSYEQIAESTHVVYWLAVTAMILPAGLLMDRIGAVRTTGLSFLFLTLYPIGLIFVGGPNSLLVVSAFYGLSHAGTSMGWMLGPVSLAPTPEKVPQYVAIHATLVGIRGKVFQLLGVGLYALTNSFTIPLVIAAAALLWSAVQMAQLRKRMERAKA